MAGSRIPLITTPITLPGGQEAPTFNLPALGLEPLWFRWFQAVDQAIASLPPPVTPPPPPTQANIQFQGAGVNLGTANPPFVSFDTGLVGTRVGNTVHVTASGGSGGIFRIPVVTTPTTPDTTLLAKCLSITGGITLSAGVFVQGDIWWIYNASASSVVITQGGGFTQTINGTATSGNMLLPANGMISVYFPIGGASCVLDGAITS